MGSLLQGFSRGHKQCWPALGSDFKILLGMIHVQAHVVVGRIQLLADSWSEGLSSLLAMGYVPCTWASPTEQLASPKAAMERVC